MKDSHQLVLTAAILLAALLIAPWIIDRIPVLGSQPRWLKIVAMFAFSGMTFFACVFGSALVMKIVTMVKQVRKTNPEE